MADGRHFLKSRNGHISATAWPYEIWHGDTHWTSEPNRQLKFRTLKKLRWRTAAIFNNKNSYISSTVWLIATKFGTLTRWRTLTLRTVSAVKKFELLKIQVGGRPQFKKCLICKRHFYANIHAVATEFNWMTRSTTLNTINTFCSNI